MVDIARGTLEEEVDVHPLPLERRTVSVRPSRIDQILGTSVPAEMAAELLESIGFDVVSKSDALHCAVPSFRPDVEREIDVIEEVARLYGYDRIPEPTYMRVPNFTSRREPGEALRRRAVQTVAALGFHEVYTNSLLSQERAASVINARSLTGGLPGDVVVTANAISSEMNALRPCLLATVLPVVAHNLNHGQPAVRVVELGHVFARAEAEEQVVPGFSEHESLLLAMAGLARPGGWDAPPRPVDLFDLKGVVEALLNDLGVPDVRIEPAVEESRLAEAHLEIRTASTVLGGLVRLDGSVRKAHEVKAEVFFAELNWTRLLEAIAPEAQQYQAAGRFPVVDRDLAFVLDEGLPVGPVQKVIERAAGPLLKSVNIFDVYSGDRLESGKKSVAFALRFGADRTLRDAEVDDRIAEIVRTVTSDFGASLRS